MSMQAARPLASCSCGALGRLLIVSVSSYEVCGLTAQLMGPFESCARSLVGVVSVHRHLFFFRFSFVFFLFFVFFFFFLSTGICTSPWAKVQEGPSEAPVRIPRLGGYPRTDVNPFRQ